MILTTFLFFFKLLYYIIIFDIILSWLSLAGIKRPQFVGDILDPMYNGIKKVLPTTFAGLDFTPIVLILILTLFQGLIITLINGGNIF